LLSLFRRLRWWELALALLPFLLGVSQVGYLTTKPFHAIFGIVLGLAVGAVGFWLNIQLTQKQWRVLLEVAAMVAVLVACFVAVEAIALILNSILPAGYFDR
jgi:NhaP-type Na+/H+ or K+/H+ antiporter